MAHQRALRTRRRATLLARAWMALACGSVAWTVAFVVRAQTAHQVLLPEGVRVAIPGGLREAPLPGVGAQGSSRWERLFSDGAPRPLVVAVQTGVAPAIGSLPLESEDVRAQALFKGITSSLAGAYDVKPRTYAPERGALSLDFKVRGPSLVSRLLAEPDTGAFWVRESRRSDVDPRLVRCLYAQLLGGAPSVTDAALRANYGAAASTCSLPIERVQLFATTTGAAAFAAEVSAFSVVAFLSKQGTVVVLSSAPLERREEARAAADFILENGQVAADARLAVVRPSFEAGRLVGVTLGSFAAALALMAGGAWLLVKAGVGVRPALGASGAAAVALALFGLLRSGSRSTPPYSSSAT
ncbi:MAG: hypothetical protein ABI895_18925 [Deltaproteobacteria bacterium]